MAESFGIDRTGKPSAWDATTVRREESRTLDLNVLMSAEYQKELEKMLLDSSPFHHRMMERDHDRIFGMPIHIIEGLPGDGIYLLDTSKLAGIMDPMRTRIETTHFGSSWKTEMVISTTTTQRRKPMDYTTLENKLEKLVRMRSRIEGLQKTKDKQPIDATLRVNIGFGGFEHFPVPIDSDEFKKLIEGEITKVEQELKLLKAEVICEVAKL